MMKARKRYRVERWSDALQRWDCIVGSEDNKSYAYGFAHGILSFYPCPRIRIAENEGSGWRSYEEFKANGAVHLSSGVAEVSMTPDEIAAEREPRDEEFGAWIAWLSRERPTRNRTSFDGWRARAAIAYIEQAELVAERDNLRERVRELAKGYLRTLLTLVIDREGATETKVWLALHPIAHEPGSVADRLLSLAEEAGVWFDDDGNEVPLAEWRARMGGAG